MLQRSISVLDIGRLKHVFEIRLASRIASLKLGSRSNPKNNAHKRDIASRLVCRNGVAAVYYVAVYYAE